MTDEAIEARLQKLAERFLTSLPGDLSTLRDAPGGEAGRAVVGAVAHRIAGRAGTFGFPALGDQAARLETLAHDGHWPSEAFDAALATLEALYASLMSARR